MKASSLPPLTAGLLLADRSACLRYRVLTELLSRPAADAEVRELRALRESDPDAAALLSEAPSLAPVQAGFDLARLRYLGFDRSYPAVSRRAEALFSLQRADGSWPLPRTGEGRRGPDGGGYDAIPLQTAIPLRGLAACGYAEDPRAERAYRWLEAMRMEDGSWPTGRAQGVYGRVGGYRRLPRSRWGCRSNTTGVLLCLAFHSSRKATEEARLALDHLLSRETKDRSTVGFEVSRLVGAALPRGLITFYAAFDAALLLELCAQVGASLEDERVRGLVEFVRSLQGPAGLWEAPRAPAVSRWLTFDLLRSLAGIPEASTWLSLAPRTPYRSYPGRPRRS